MYTITSFLGLFFLATRMLSPCQEPIYTPETNLGAEIYSYAGHRLQYDERFEQADWVAYELTEEEVYGTAAERNKTFHQDASIRTGSAEDSDYNKSGYDRGHLAPAADMKFLKEAMDDCFLYSNMSPQEPSFNRGIWAELEAVVRYWAVRNGAIQVVTGPVLDKKQYPTIGPNEVAVPDFFYKVILDYREPEIKAIAFIIPNKKAEKKLNQYACTINDAERITGINFFPAIPDDEEELIESNINIKLWPFIRYARED